MQKLVELFLESITVCVFFLLLQGDFVPLQPLENRKFSGFWKTVKTEGVSKGAKLPLKERREYSRTESLE